MSFLLRRKGTSIAELVVVIAVLAIVSTIVVSFIVVANEKVRTGNDRLNAINDITIIENKIDVWFEEQSTLNYDFSTIHRGSYADLVATSSDGTSEYILSFFEGSLKLAYYVNDVCQSETILHTSTLIKKTNFIVSKRSENKEYLVICQISYDIHRTLIEDKDSTATQVYAFALNNYKFLESSGT